MVRLRFLLAALSPLLLLAGCSRHGVSPVPHAAAPALPSSPAWVWLAGSRFAGSSGNYGLRGQFTAGATPPGRSNGVAWGDAAGNFWIFGGESAPTSTADTWYNDLWEFTHGRWIWVSGSDQPDQPGVYGTRGAAELGNVPGARASSAGWIDASGHLWLFGGLGLDVAGSSNAMNDLWRFSAGQWTWMGGSRTGTQSEPGVYGSRGESSAGNRPGARWGAASWTDAEGSFWLFGGIGVDGHGRSGYLSDLWKYSGGEWSWMGGSDRADQPAVYGARNVGDPGNTPGARGNATAWVDAAGNFWLFGGSTIPGNRFSPLGDLWKYSRGQWTWVGGSSAQGARGIYGTLGYAAAENQPGARNHGVAWADRSGNLWLFGGDGIDTEGRGEVLSDLWRYSDGQWAWMGGPDRVNQPGDYGILDILSPANLPGARYNSFAATVGGRFLLFGGDGNDSTGTLGSLNDLWSFQPSQ